jgi:hypothetical protein
MSRAFVKEVEAEPIDLPDCAVSSHRLVLFPSCKFGRFWLATLALAVGAHCQIRSLALIMKRCLIEQGQPYGQGSFGRVQ